MAFDQWSHAKRLLNALVEAEPDDPDAWLDDQCDDAALRTEVKSLYVAHEHSIFDEGTVRGWLDGSTEDSADRLLIHDRPDTGATVGEYRLLEEIGLGGMSVVYRAERVGADFDQTVAVKLLQRRVLADSAGQRFRAERQVLASLDHPNIARLIDGGVTEGGRPYLVMEYVDGTPITQYADRKQLGLDARLDLLGQVLEAVQAAHRQLVVHRDLKPANVLVTETEDGPRVKLLDFGIAKLLDDSLPVTRPETQTGHHLMTPSYAAPEQITGADVTTATDVYQVGVLAYELLAGRRPFDVENKSATEIERLVTEVDPPPPSERAGGGLVSPEELRGDLDRILQKTLRKEPERRYRSTAALDADLERHQAGQPVEARPATLRYRTKKFVQRHRWGVGVAVAFLCVIAVSVVLLVRQRNQAQQEAQKAERVSSFLTNLFENARPSEVQGDTVTARELLRRGVERVESLENQPEVQVQMLDVIGEVYRERGRYQRAESLFVKALSTRRGAKESQAGVASIISNLGHVRYLRDEDRSADSLLQRALRIQSTNSPTYWTDRAEMLTRHGLVLHDLGEFEQSEKRHRAALDIFQSMYDTPHPKVAEVLNNLAMVLHEQHRFEEAEELYRKTLAIQRKLLTAPHPDIADTVNNLAYVFRSQSEYAQAEKHFRQALDMDRELYGKSHPYVAFDYHNVGRSLMEQDQYVDAILRLQQSKRISKELLPDTRKLLFSTYQRLGRCFIALEDYARAEPLLQKALTLQKKEEDLESDDRQAVIKDFVRLYEAWDKPSKAQKYASVDGQGTV